MRRTRIWRLMTAALAATALLMTTSAGVATAQSPEDLTGPLEDILEQVGGDEGGEPSLDDLVGALDPEQLQELEELLDQSQLEDLLETLGLEDLQELLDPDSLPEGPEGEEPEGPDVGEGEAGAGTVPGTEMGGFIGTAHGTGLEVGVGLPQELADGLEPLLDGLGIRDEETGGIRIAFAETEAQLQRAGEGEEVDGLARALATNLLLDSGAADSPGECTGGDTVALPPDQDPPLLEVTIANIDCEQDDERAFADAQLAGVEITLAGLIEAGLPAETRDGLDQALDPINNELLAQLNDACSDSVGAILDQLLPDNQACEALELQINNPLDVGIPLVDVDLLGSTSEVTADDEQVAAEASATLEQVNVLGLACVGGDGTEPLTYRAAALSPVGGEGSYETAAPDAQARLCDNEPSILRLISDSGALEDPRLFEEDVQDLLDGQLAALFDGLEELMNAINTSVVTDGEPYGDTDGAGAVGGVTPLTIVGTAPLSEIPGLNEFLGDLEVRVEAMEVEAAANTEPAGDEVDEVSDDVQASETEPEGDLPTTGASAAGALGVAALVGAVALRRRED